MAHDAILGTRRRALPIVIVGHVDHGKSTLVGRLLHDTGSLSDDRLDNIRTISAKRGLELEWSFLLDALQIERDQGITVDSTQVWFHSVRRRYVIIDAPGHKEFLRNMISGAASADAAILVVDAGMGLGEQTRRHARVLELIGLKQVAVAVNKIDVVGYDRARFLALADELHGFLAGLGIEPAAIVPLSARHGDNIVAPSARMPWYGGPALVEVLDRFEARPQPVEQPLRLPVQDVYRRDERRVVVGRIESGTLRVGEALRFAPLGTTARVARIEGWNHAHPKRSAAAGESVALVLDEEVVVERGNVASAIEAAPVSSHVAVVRLIWLDSEPLVPGRRLTLRVATARHDVVVETIERLDETEASAACVERNGVATVQLCSRVAMALDAFASHPRTGRGVLVDGHRVVGGAIVEGVVPVVRASDLVAPALTVEANERAAVNGHRGGVLWLTGLSGAGKSTLATGLMRRLFDRGHQVYVLDGDSLRQGLNRDLGFSPGERTENIRRAAEVARLFADAGLIVVVALISPTASDRLAARRIVGESFREIYVSADLETCRTRDPKGLYARALAGKIADFTGISAPYEAPAAPDLVVDTTDGDLARSLDALTRYAEASFAKIVEKRIAS